MRYTRVQIHGSRNTGLAKSNRSCKKNGIFSGPSRVAGSAPPASPSRVRVTGNTGVDPVPLTRPLGPRVPLTRLVPATRATCSTSRRRRTRSPGDRIRDRKIWKSEKIFDFQNAPFGLKIGLNHLRIGISRRAASFAMVII